MSLPNFSVKRPVTVNMFVLAAVLLGLISCSRLSHELFPAMEYPQVTVATSYKGAAPEEVETLVTRLIEESVGTVAGVKHIRSVSREELSLVMVEFNWGANMDMASLAVREKIDLIKERLPRGSSEPVVVKYNPFELPVMVINVVGDYPDSQLRQIATKHIKGELEKIDGVASCSVSGGAQKEIQVDLDQARLSAWGLSVADVSEAIRNSNLNYPAGTIEENFYEQLIRTVGEFKNVEEIKNVPVNLRQGRVEETPETGTLTQSMRAHEAANRPAAKMVFVKDLADVKEGLKERTSIARHNLRSTVTISIQKRAGANSVQLAQSIKDRIKEIRLSLPKGVSFEITYDQSLFIKDAINGVGDAAVQGGLLSFLVLLFFLGSWQAAGIVALSIPISVLVTFSAMYFNGVSMNMISLGGLALGVGMLVDCAIVVVENISRRRSLGEDPAKASMEGATEMTSPLFSTVTTTVIVFLPMIFVVGAAGQIFKELSFTVTVSLFASLLAALTFIPAVMAKSNIVVVGGSTGHNITGWLQEAYRRYMSGLIVDRPRCDRLLFRLAALFLAALLAASVMDKELMPAIDQGQFTIKLELPPGSNLNATDTVAALIEKKLLSDPSVKDVTVEIGSDKEKKAAEALNVMGPHQARMMVALKPRRPWWALVDLWGHYRHTASRRLIQDLKKYLAGKDLRGAELEYVLQESVFQAAMGSSAPMVVDIKGYDLDYMRSLAEQIRSGLTAIKGLYGVRDSLTLPSPETKIFIDKDKAAVMGLSTSDIASSAQAAVDGRLSSKFKRESREIDIRVRLRSGDREDPAALRKLIVNSPAGIQVVLGDVAQVKPGRGPSQILRDDQERVVHIWANIYRRSPSSVNNQIQRQVLSRLKVKPDYSVKLAGQAVEMNESFRSLLFALILSLVLVYMVMASQFESLSQPFLIMYTIPLGLIGAIAGLILTFSRLNVMVFMGAIVLGGVVTSHSIVLIDCINSLRRSGKSLREAAVEGGVIRLRPILMTAVTTVIGLAPLAVGSSDGALLQRPMAITIMAGLSLATFFTLVVLPILYLRTEDR